MPRIPCNEIDRHIAERLRQRRTDWGLSMRQVGEAVGITGQQIQKYETAANRVPASRLYTIAHQLQVPITYFLPDTQVREAKLQDEKK